MEKTKKSLETRLAKLNDTSRKDDVVTFEELGVDRIFVDEAHYYFLNLEYPKLYLLFVFVFLIYLLILK